MHRNRRLGFATVAILKAVDAEHRYGLDIIEHTGLATGTVYVTLGRLQKRGFVTTAWEKQRMADADGRPRRRYYDLTRAGREALHAALDEFGALASGEAISKASRSAPVARS